MGFRVLTVAAVLLCWALPLKAQQSVELEFDAGRVTLRAQNVSARAILAEWARLVGAIIVNADRVAGPPLTIELTGVPEQQALDINPAEHGRLCAGASPTWIGQHVGIRPCDDPGHQRRA